MRVCPSLRFIALALLLSLATPSFILAQSTTLALIRREVTVSSCPHPQCPVGPAQLIEIDVEGARFTSVVAVPFEHVEVPYLTATADGRYLVWLGNTSTTPPLLPVDLSIFDRATRMPGVGYRQPPPTPPLAGVDSRIEAQPFQQRVFARLYGQPTLAVDATGARPLDAIGQFQTFYGLTGDGAVTLVGVYEPSEAVRLDTESGAVIGRIAMPTGLLDLAISRDGASVYSIRHRGTGVLTITLYDAVTGAVLVERQHPFLPASGLSIPDLEVHPQTGRLFMDDGGGRYRVLDPITLEQVGSFATPLHPLSPSEPYAGRGVSGRLVFDPHHPRAFLLANREARYETNNPGVSRIDIIDLGTLAIAGGGDLGMQVGPSDLVVVPRPAAPAGLVAEVTSPRVTLRWSHGGGQGLAVGYRVEAGSAPGLADLARFELGTANELVVDGVPSGAYYVRVRGTNWAGVSDASNEIVVTVP
jgi:hypothetical protein